MTDEEKKLKKHIIYLRNKEKNKEKRKLYYYENREEIAKKEKEYRESKKEIIKEKRKQRYLIYKEKNKDSIKLKRQIYYQKNKEKLRLYRNEYRWNVEGCGKRVQVPQDKNSIEYKNHVLKVRLKKVYNISLDEFNIMYEKQEGKCAICKKEEVIVQKNNKIMRLSVDHCHNSKKVRGLLCGKCNRGIGNFNDDINLLQSAIEYIKQF